MKTLRLEFALRESIVCCHIRLCYTTYREGFTLFIILTHVGLLVVTVVTSMSDHD